MNYYSKHPQMTLSDRLAIEVGIERKEPFKAIAKHLNRHPSSIAHEVKENRTFIRGSYPGGNDCRFARQCAVQHIQQEHLSLILSRSISMNSWQLEYSTV